MIVQAPKFRTLTIKIYRYRNLDLAVTIAKIVHNFSVAEKKKNNILLKTKDFRGKINVLCNILLKTESFREKISVLRHINSGIQQFLE